jgi:hypothetical protein
MIIHWPLARGGPRRFAIGGAAGKSVRSWTAPVLWRFGCALGIDDGGNSASTSLRSWGEG